MREAGTFDYVIAEGAFRDRPVGNRREFLRVLGGLLAPDGLALVCYEVLPGAAARMALEDGTYVTDERVRARSRARCSSARVR